MPRTSSPSSYAMAPSKPIYTNESDGKQRLSIHGQGVDKQAGTQLNLSTIRAEEAPPVNNGLKRAKSALPGTRKHGSTKIMS